MVIAMNRVAPLYNHACFMSRIDTQHLLVFGWKKKHQKKEVAYLSQLLLHQ
jgi:hypothetical protein